MSEILGKKIETTFGELKYYRTKKGKHDFDILFIHGLGGNKKWFPSHFKEYKLDEYSWIVPDLIGFGDSSKPDLQEAYTMSKQASNLRQLVIEEDVQSLVILAHSMGGPIAISLIEQLAQLIDPEIKVLGLFYLEGNLDKNDAFFSSQIAKHSFEEYEKNFESWLDDLIEKVEENDKEFFIDLREVGPSPLWASSVDLVSISESNQLLPRLQSAIRAHDSPINFIFGERNKGLFTSETLIKRSQLPLIFIPEAGHAMFIDNPNSFWKNIKQLINS